MVICFKYLDDIYNIENLLIADKIYNIKFPDALKLVKKIKSDVFNNINSKELIGIYLSYGNNRYEFIGNKSIKISDNEYFTKSGMRNFERNTDAYYIDKVNVNNIDFKICKEKIKLYKIQDDLNSKIKKTKSQLNLQQTNQYYNDDITEYLNSQLKEIFEFVEITELPNNNYSIKIIDEVPIDILATKYNRQQINSRVSFINDYVINRFEEIKNIINEISTNNYLQILKAQHTSINKIQISLTNVEFPKIHYKFIIG